VSADDKRTGGAVEEAGDPAGVDPVGAGAVARGFARAMLAGDHDAAASYFSADALIVTPDDTQVRGRTAIGRLLGQLTSSGPKLEIRTGRTVVAAEVALCTQFWRRRGSGRGPGRFESQTTARLVLVPRADRWQIAIAIPWE
jgi:ketosteroid isomerase-like protein